MVVTSVSDRKHTIDEKLSSYLCSVWDSHPKDPNTAANNYPNTAMQIKT